MWVGAGHRLGAGEMSQAPHARRCHLDTRCRLL